jgi:hypothetical protein
VRSGEVVELAALDAGDERANPRRVYVLSGLSRRETPA